MLKACARTTKITFCLLPMFDLRIIYNWVINNKLATTALDAASQPYCSVKKGKVINKSDRKNEIFLSKVLSRVFFKIIPVKKCTENKKRWVIVGEKI